MRNKWQNSFALTDMLTANFVTLTFKKQLCPYQHKLIRCFTILYFYCTRVKLQPIKNLYIHWYRKFERDNE